MPDQLNLLGVEDPPPRPTDNGPKPGDGPAPDLAGVLIEFLSQEEK